MLHAILKGKAGTLSATVSPGDAWRQVYRSSEDLLTATTFERLAYLDGPTLWAIIVSTFRSGALPARRVAELLEIEFWPIWQEAAAVLGQAVEPDVLLTLSIGDPAQRIALIVECKAGGGRQYSDQWAREWLAFQAETAVTEQPDEVWLLALGGLPESAGRTVAKFSDDIRTRWNTEIRALAAEWSDLARALDEVNAPSRVAARIIQDLRLALELHGYRNVRPMNGLADDAGQYALSPASIVALRAVPSAAKVKPPKKRPTFTPMQDLPRAAALYAFGKLSGRLLKTS